METWHNLPPELQFFAILGAVIAFVLVMACLAAARHG